MSAPPGPDRPAPAGRNSDPPAGGLPAGGVLLIRFSSLGDVVLATAAAARLRQAAPGRPIVFLTRAAWAPLLLHHPAIDRIVTLEDAGAGGLDSLRHALSAVRWAGLLDLHGSLRSRWLAARLPAGARVRYASRGAGRRLLVLAPRLARRMGLDRAWRVVDAQVAAAERLAGRLAEAGGPAPAPPVLPSIHLAPGEAREAARAWAELGLPDGAVGLCPGARHATKRWPVEYYAALADRLAAAGQAAVPVFLADDAADREAERVLSQAVRPSTRLVILRRPLRQAAALLARCRTIVSNDSGLMHLAAALGVPVVALFGPTVGAFGFLPCGPGHRVMEIELECRPCSLHGGPVCPRGHFRCLRDIEPDIVFAALGAGSTPDADLGRGGFACS